MTDSKQQWQMLSSEIVYENPWIRVEDHAVVNPSGKQSQYGKVCFKNHAIAILAVDTAGNLYLVGQQRYTLDEYSWELPMGGGPLAEDPLAAAKRELREETGLSANHWQKVMRVHTSNSVTDEIGYVYLAQDLIEGVPEFEDTEDLEIKVLPLSEALQWVHRGQITDAISVAAILKLALDAEQLLA
ncbi:MAG: NUDIX domain-containing protein [Candidatus Rariloculaceae bacterium]